jgi:hypothetical protein
MASPSSAAVAHFEEVVSAWDEPLCCQTSQSPRPCRNQARWLAVDNHSACERQLPTVLLCSFHKTRWQQLVLEKLAYWGYTQCGSCGQRFATPAQSVTFRPV